MALATALPGTGCAAGAVHLTSAHLASVSGRAVFPSEAAASSGSRQVAALLSDVANGATVSLIDPTTGNTIASTVTTPAGAFVLTFSSSFSPQPSVPYYLEAVKGLAQNAVGNSAVRLRTLIEWTGTAWISLTSGTLEISLSTTAISALANHYGLSTTQIQALLGTVTIGTADTSLSPTTPDTFVPTSGITDEAFHRAYQIVSADLAANRDPLAETTWSPPAGYHYAIPITMTDAGGYTRDNVAVSLNVDFASLLGASGSIDPSSPLILDADANQFLSTYYDPSSGPAGAVRWIIPQLVGGSVHHYFLYFDTTANGPKPAESPLFAPVVSLYDPTYPVSWTSLAQVDQVSQSVASDGGEIVNAAQLASFMQWVISDGISDTTAVITQDVCPDTVLNSGGPGSLIRQYLDAGGRVIWAHDTVLHYLGASNGTSTSVADGFGVLGISENENNIWFGGTEVMGGTVTLSAAATAWGLLNPWNSDRPYLASDFQAPNDVILATDGYGNASGWLKNYDTTHPYSGFLRIWDVSLTLTAGQLSDLWNVSSYRQGGSFTMGSVQTL